MQTKAILKYVSEIKQVSEKYTKRDFIATIDFDQQYPQDLMFQLGNTRVDLLEGYPIGSEILISYAFRGKMFTSADGKVSCFNNLDVFKIDGNKAQGASSHQNKGVAPIPLADESNSTADDLPF